MSRFELWSGTKLNCEILRGLSKQLLQKSLGTIIHIRVSSWFTVCMYVYLACIVVLKSHIIADGLGEDLLQNSRLSTTQSSN